MITGNEPVNAANLKAASAGLAGAIARSMRPNPTEFACIGDGGTYVRGGRFAANGDKSLTCNEGGVYSIRASAALATDSSSERCAVLLVEIGEEVIPLTAASSSGAVIAGGTSNCMASFHQTQFAVRIDEGARVSASASGSRIKVYVYLDFEKIG